jgi:hypothetical protein
VDVSGKLFALGALILVPTEYDLLLFSTFIPGLPPPSFFLNYSEATERISWVVMMKVSPEAFSGFRQPYVIFCCQAYGMVITTNIHVNKMARHLEGSEG